MSIQLSELMIVGYADRCGPTTSPAIVPPVFHRPDAAGGVVLVPPYLIKGDHVHDATEITISEARGMHDDREITLFAVSFPALAGCCLVVGKHGKALYVEREQARAMVADSLRQAETKIAAIRGVK
jgi:hypothetical protein